MKTGTHLAHGGRVQKIPKSALPAMPWKLTMDLYYSNYPATLKVF